MARAPHDRAAPRALDLIEQHLARLDVGDDGRPGMALQHVARQQHHELVAPQDLARPIDHAEPVGVTVEGEAEIELLAQHEVAQLLEILGHGWVGMVRGEGPVHPLIDDAVPPRQAAGEEGHGRPCRAVARIPAHLELAAAAVVGGQSLHIRLQHGRLARRSLADLERALGGDLSQPLDGRAMHGLVPQHHLEAVIVRRIVRAGHHHPAVGGQVEDGEIEHRRGPEPDAQDLQPGRCQSFDQRPFELGRAQPAVIADRDRAPAATLELGPIRAAQRRCIGREQGLSDQAADVVFAQDRRVEAMSGRHSPPPPLGAETAETGRPMQV
jgi:hypothetical protein